MLWAATLCFLLVSARGVLAGLWLGGTSPYIEGVPIFLYSNSTSLNNVDTSAEYPDIRELIPSTNQTVSSNGLTGLLYDRGYSCVQNPPEALPGLPAPFNNGTKIALIRIGQCSLVQKVLLAQYDNANATIIYINGEFDSETNQLMDIPPGNITIPTFLVGGADGLMYLNAIKTLSHYNNSLPNNVTVDKALKVTMYPAVGVFPNTWEFTLIIVVSLLAASFIVSVILHWHLWRVRRRQRALIEQGIVLTQTSASIIPQDKTLIDPSQLEIFPARIVGDDDHESQPPTEEAETNADMTERRLSRRVSLLSVRSNRSTRSAHALENAEALAACSEGDLPQAAKAALMIPAEGDDQAKDADDQEENKPDLSTNNNNEREVSPPNVNVLNSTNIAQSQPDAMCVICLDDFDKGEKVRRLPCGHEFHCECIDPWLTVKSASCPLCKHDCSLSVPRTESNENSQTPQLPPQAAASNSRFQSFFSLTPTSSPSSFGPTITADNAAEFSQSWMARSLPRNMRRQLEAASAAINGPTMELPARMTGNPNPPVQNRDLEANSSQEGPPNRLARVKGQVG
ncbi:hypothetical protein K450DRAFT_252665 [Umbelopsis ramanniana AG]|uniref:RING-type domain-containing protein n=1 Tax=Umbelopsis ramanniana AG TaxID=1314678 RepID=A0AAD5E4D2_UMBRA|nr:uncharacterized protein K450DRAFT_252665 [Umbelopsis ramanniana AG]KAI8577333.1 hypothetical protein K450DRAFT_252665 [Umbelopsis ramanniana AG]